MFPAFFLAAFAALARGFAPTLGIGSLLSVLLGVRGEAPIKINREGSLRGGNGPST